MTILLLFVVGIACGVINTVAGAGSLLTLPALIFAGVPGTAANATNRLGIVAQGLTGVWQFRKRKVREDHLSWRVIAAGLFGSVIGAWIAAHVPDDQFEHVLGVLMLVLLVLIMRDPKPRVAAVAEGVDAWSHLSPGRRVVMLAVFFVLGIYAGFLQAGVGIMILLALGGIAGLELVRGNYIKIIFTLVLNAVALGVFIWQGVPIYWMEGLTLTVGQSIGAVAGTWVAVVKGNRWIRWFMVAAAVLSSAKLLGVFAWFGIGE